MQTFYSHGKLLLTAEYVVLDGAKALAVPTKFGQQLTVESIDKPQIIWTSLNHNNAIWFEDIFSLDEIKVGYLSRNPISDRLIQILKAIKQLNPEFLTCKTGFKITTILEFPKNWGLGTSSTLINNLAQWANVDPYQLLNLTFGGSGYDIACAQNNKAIVYQLTDNLPVINTLDFKLDFFENLYFIHLNKKQNSRDGIAHYKANKHDLANTIKAINAITSNVIKSETLEDLKNLIEQHETIISTITNQTKVKDTLFSDFNGSIKSLGAWGGDFILVASKTNPTDYFKAKGFNTILNYKDMVL